MGKLLWYLQACSRVRLFQAAPRPNERGWNEEGFALSLQDRG